ncbi:hypothetical protein QA648_29550 (plasmid) [Rhizobium sp. CB3171]|uniref:hypothetical protein n=2 Tax=unclassified Rhizobium TaxID=2613769 RepID=UPI0024B047E0|nr:hypothetical protein [Rhizobium sp. CB3171]WFU04903.1 hypothetical protein QA648_29550 [Rhizobium sp. CB3171]
MTFNIIQRIAGASSTASGARCEEERKAGLLLRIDGRSRQQSRMSCETSGSTVKSKQASRLKEVLEMNTRYEIGPLQANQIERAYLVVQAVMPGLAWDRWRAAVGTVFERQRFTVATGPNDCVRAVCLARVFEHPIAGRLFDIPIFVVISPLDEERIARELFSLMKGRAIGAGCSHMRFWTLNDEVWERLADEGFRNRWDHGLVYRLESESINPAWR